MHAGSGAEHCLLRAPRRASSIGNELIRVGRNGCGACPGAGSVPDSPPMEEFQGKVVVLTGASEGIGRAIALELARQGPRLALAARSRDRLEVVAAECGRLGAETQVVPTDVTDREQCDALVAATTDRWGGIDMLVNNAGRTMWARVEELETPSVLEDLMAVNYLGAAWCTMAALPHLKASQGRIVAVASVAGLTGVPARSGYCATKHAMVGFFESLRIELAGTGVTVTIVAPDFVLSELHRRAMDGKGRPLGESPMQEDRIMSAERCAQLIVAAATRRKRLLVTSWRGRVGRWLRLPCPGVVDGIARRAIARRR